MLVEDIEVDNVANELDDMVVDMEVERGGQHGDGQGSRHKGCQLEVEGH